MSRGLQAWASGYYVPKEQRGQKPSDVSSDAIGSQVALQIALIL
jgi:hypothetical protein